MERALKISINTVAKNCIIQSKFKHQTNRLLWEQTRVAWSKQIRKSAVKLLQIWTRAHCTEI